MAQRRMFSLQIVDSDAFLDMPTSSQLLYFHLSMRADDDGFVDNPKKILRMVGANDDDYKVLIAKRFILTFESGIIVIKHWKIHNYIQADRYHETKYLSEKNGLIIKENGAYTDRVQDVSIMDTQVRLEQEQELELGNIASENPPIVEFVLKDEIKKLMENERRELRIIGWFIHKKKIVLKNKAQLGETIRRHLRAGKSLTSFEVKQLETASDNADRLMGNKWTLETLHKLLTK